ncbi:MAG: hypothetical protein EOP24_32940 [Hyphomicrobiales bacterium]|nr:MAG: hypothetical protein EOP24_32940 [Hyphomicrobiales bacterium]
MSYQLAASCALLLFGSCATAQTITSGTYSPVMTNSGSGTQNFTVNNFPQVIRRSETLEAGGAKSLKGMTRLVEQGQFEQARKKLATFEVEQQAFIRSAANARFLQGQLYSLEGRPDRADEDIKTAFSLDPQNCLYRGSLAANAVALGKYEVAEKLASPKHAARCYASGSTEEKLLLRVVQARVSGERRDKGEALSALRMGYQEVVSLRRATPLRQEQWTGACAFFQLATAYFPEYVKNEWTSAADVCKSALGIRDSGERTAAALVLSFYEQSRHATALETGREIAARWSSFDEQAFAGADLEQRRQLYGAFMSEYGFRLFWSAGDPGQAAKAYLSAFATLSPLIESGRPEVISAMAQLIIRIQHLNSLWAHRKVFGEDGADQLLSAIKRLVKSYQPLVTPDHCSIQGRILDVAAGKMAANLLMHLRRQYLDCIDTAAPSWSYTSARLRLESIPKADFTAPEDAEQTQLRTIKARSRLREFPGFGSFHALQSFDMWALAVTRKRRNASDEGHDKQFAIDVQAAFDEGLSGDSSDVRDFMADMLPFVDPVPRASQFARQILHRTRLDWSTAKELTSNSCFTQASAIRVSMRVATFATSASEPALFDEAVQVFQDNLSRGNTCTLASSDKKLTGDDLYRQQIDRALLDLSELKRFKSTGGNSMKEDLKSCFEILKESGEIPICALVATKNSADHPLAGAKNP